MVITCAAAFCYNSNVDKQRPVSFFRFPKDVQQSNKWSLLIGRHDLLDGKINSQRVCSDHFDKSSITSPTVGTNKRLVSGAMPITVFQTDEFSKIPLDKSSGNIEKCLTPVNNKEPLNCISTSNTPSHSQTSAQISQFISTNTSSVRYCKSKDSDKERKIKFFKFSKDKPCSLMWIQSVNEENNVSENNSLSCNVHLSNGVYKRRLNLLKLSRKAASSISNLGNVGQNITPKIIVMNSNLKSSQKPDRKSNILSDHTYVCSGNIKLQKMNSNSDSKSRKHVKKYHDKLSDHSYVLKLPASSTRDVMSSGIDTVQNLKLKDRVINEPYCIIDLTGSDKPANKSTRSIENSSLVQIDKNSFENSEIDWRGIVSAQSIIIKELRKKIKVLQQKIRRHNTKIEALQMKAI